MKKFIILAGFAFVISLGIVMGVRMSADAMAVIIGIIFGLLASIPTSIILVWVLRQRDRQFEAQFSQGRPFGPYHPPVVVVNGHGTNGYGYNSLPAPQLPVAPASPAGRQFKVIGQDNTETIGDVLPPFWDEL
jgi:hypothetical protein